MGTDVMIYIPSFLKYWFRHSKVNGGKGGIHRHTDGMDIAKVYFRKMHFKNN
jgi:hypothetical protein